MALRPYEVFTFTKPEPPALSFDAVKTFIEAIDARKFLILDGIGYGPSNTHRLVSTYLAKVIERVDFDPDHNDFSRRSLLVQESKRSPGYMYDPVNIARHPSSQLMNSLMDAIEKAERNFSGGAAAPKVFMEMQEGEPKAPAPMVEKLRLDLIEMKPFANLKARPAHIVIGNMMEKTGYVPPIWLMANRHLLGGEFPGVIPFVNRHISPAICSDLLSHAQKFERNRMEKDIYNGWMGAVKQLVGLPEENAVASAMAQHKVAVSEKAEKEVNDLSGILGAADESQIEQYRGVLQEFFGGFEPETEVSAVTLSRLNKRLRAAKEPKPAEPAPKPDEQNEAWASW